MKITTLVLILVEPTCVPPSRILTPVRFFTSGSPNSGCGRTGGRHWSDRPAHPRADTGKRIRRLHQGRGIGVPGTPDIDTGVIQFLPNLPGKWLNVPLRSIVEQQVELPVALINDVRAITLRMDLRRRASADTIACLAIGTRHWRGRGRERSIPSWHWRHGGRIRSPRRGGRWTSLRLRRRLSGTVRLRARSRRWVSRK